MRTSLLATVLATSLARPVAMHAQSLAQRVRAVGTGMAEVTFAARPGVCGDGRNYVSLGGDMRIGTVFDDDGRAQGNCLPGPVRVRVRVENGVVRDVRAYVGPSRSSDGATAIGPVSTREAADYFLGLARTVRGNAGTRSILPAMLADSVVVWPQLVSIARDTGSLIRSTRTDAAFWLSRLAASKLNRHPNDLRSDDPGARGRDDAKSAAVFALSQLPRNEGVPSLLEVARTNREPRVRDAALFWLSQSGDPRGVELFESILKSRY